MASFKLLSTQTSERQVADDLLLHPGLLMQKLVYAKSSEEGRNSLYVQYTTSVLPVTVQATTRRLTLL